jgi:hypothetical protein
VRLSQKGSTRKKLVDGLTMPRPAAHFFQIPVYSDRESNKAANPNSLTDSSCHSEFRPVLPKCSLEFAS